MSVSHYCSNFVNPTYKPQIAEGKTNSGDLMKAASKNRPPSQLKRLQ